MDTNDVKSDEEVDPVEVDRRNQELTEQNNRDEDFARRSEWKLGDYVAYALAGAMVTAVVCPTCSKFLMPSGHRRLEKQRRSLLRKSPSPSQERAERPRSRI